MSPPAGSRCPPWCDRAHDDGIHTRLVYAGPGPEGTCHVTLIQPSTQPIAVQITLERDERDAEEAPPDGSCEEYTAHTARQMAELAHLAGYDDFADALTEASDLADRHRDPRLPEPEVPVVVPTAVWQQITDHHPGPDSR
ncbi:hypothetical protein [Nocardiopsis sp. FR26]|uniref:hypothetical protein n=1 Tax=Nocardiopsis sp. FR26 TaxID=2605987 RepID=UPI00135BCC86|nr:hypothetical protein [Nocardiopsis sp. FR26]